MVLYMFLLSVYHQFYFYFRSWRIPPWPLLLETSSRRLYPNPETAVLEAVAYEIYFVSPIFKFQINEFSSGLYVRMNFCFWTKECKLFFLKFFFALKVNIYLQNTSIKLRLARFEKKCIFVVVCVQLISQHH
jgi:hypothetical protein